MGADDAVYKKLFNCKWAWRSVGKVDHAMADGAAERRSCLGVYQCEGCGRVSRPKSDVHAREKQLAATCTQCRGRQIKHSCAAHTFRYTRPRNGTQYRVWEHQGHHSHAKPPGGRVSQHEEDAIDQQVLRRHDANAPSGKAYISYVSYR